MNPFLTNIVIRTTLKKKAAAGAVKKSYTAFELAKGLRELKLSIIRHTRDFILITSGIFSAAFGFKGFLLTNLLLMAVPPVFHCLSLH